MMFLWLDIWSQLSEEDQERVKKGIGFDVKAVELAGDLPPEVRGCLIIRNALIIHSEYNQL